MKPSSLAGHICELLEILLHDPRPADHLIDVFFRQRRYLGSHDRRALAESAYGILRHRRLLQTLIAGVDEQKAFAPAWLLAAYKIHLEKRPSESLHELALPLSFQQIKKLADQNAAEIGRNHPGVRCSFPDWLVAALQQQFGAESEVLLAALNQPPPLTLRVNTLKATREVCLRELQQRGYECAPTALAPAGIQLHKRTNLFTLDLFREGWFEVQDEGSQLIALLLDPKPNWRVADMCAGGGGKTLHLASLMKNRGEIFAFDVSAPRLENLKKRARRSGIHNVRVQALKPNETPQNLHGQMDAILIDAPCSGTGVLRRNPDAKWKITAAMVNEMAAKQRQILRAYSPLLKLGGRLVYATCSLLAEENAQIVEDFLAKHSEFRAGAAAAILQRYDLAKLAEGNQMILLPHRHGCDGFFAAVMERV
ncbi:RsmB/NOP family class I SAM-dependent RNA methyltransferase [candidate division KSB1 bacterium]|nr:RsmB/NOP family class I SAM-dependent RNA methyltransferase [candidate division KSB1 bacterium]